MKNAVVKKLVITGSSLLLLSAAVVLTTTPNSAFAAQLFGRDSKPQDKTRLLSGKVLDNGDNPLKDAVVYLTNTHTRSVKTYIVGPDGTYRFPALQPNIDYEVYAQFNNRKSHTKTVSQFDNRQAVYIDLKVDSKENENK
jgi:Carboxypeptidase regulatory-like domain